MRGEVIDFTVVKDVCHITIFYRITKMATLAAEGQSIKEKVEVQTVLMVENREMIHSQEFERVISDNDNDN